MMIIIIIIIIAPLSIMSKDKLGDLKCLHKACQSAITDGRLFRDTGVDEEVKMNDRVKNDCEMKTVSIGQGVCEPTRVDAKD